MSELNEKLATAWEGFTKGDWQNEVNVRDFIQKNYTPYEGDESFLAGATEATTTLWDKVMEGHALPEQVYFVCYDEENAHLYERLLTQQGDE